MASIRPQRSIHHRRRWYYVLWVILLVLAAALVGWWETPAQEGSGRFSMSLQCLDLPPGTKATLWTGPTKNWNEGWNPAGSWVPVEAGELTLEQKNLRIAHRRLGQGLLLRRTHDLAIVLLEAPSGERRALVYDLREDLSSLLAIGRHLTVKIQISWAQMPRDPVIPPDSKRVAVGH